MSRQVQLATLPDARALLRAAIEQHQHALEQTARVQAASQHAFETVLASIRQVDEAEAQFADQRRNDGERLAAVALGEATGDSMSEADLTRLRNDLQTARRTHEALQQRAEREQAEVARAQRQVKETALEVMRVEVPIANMLSRAQALQTELVAARSELREIFRMNAAGDIDLKSIERFLRDVDLPAWGQPEFVDFDNHRSAAAWRNALVQLQSDAEARLPV